jgi:hypothetical protein
VGQNPAAAADAGPPVEQFQIGAQIRSIKKGKLTLFAPNPYFRPALEIELAEEPEISLDLGGLKYLMLVKKGDKIVESRGTQVGQNRAQLTEVVIELAEPFGTQQAPGKRPPRRSARPSRRATTEEPEGEAVEQKKEESGEGQTQS